MTSSSPIELAVGQLTRSDSLIIQLIKPSDAPAAILLQWPPAATVLPPTPRALADIAAAVVRTLAAAQSRLATIRRR